MASDPRLFYTVKVWETAHDLWPTGVRKHHLEAATWRHSQWVRSEAWLCHEGKAPLRMQLCAPGAKSAKHKWSPYFHCPWPTRGLHGSTGCLGSVGGPRPKGVHFLQGSSEAQATAISRTLWTSCVQRPAVKREDTRFTGRWHGPHYVVGAGRKVWDSCGPFGHLLVLPWPTVTNSYSSPSSTRSRAQTPWRIQVWVISLSKPWRPTEVISGGRENECNSKGEESQWGSLSH